MTMSPVGVTAQWIAAARALETESETPLFSDPFARELAGDAGFALLATIREAAGAASFKGPDPYLSVRTRFLDDALLGVVRDRAITQVAILAAGMDTRAFRLEWPAGVMLFEVDRDDIFDYKEPVLQRLNAVVRCDRRIIRSDLTREWTGDLRAAGFDRTRPTAFLAEGLVMYLHPENVDRVFRAVGGVAADGSWIGLDTANEELLTSPFTAGYLKKLADLGCGWHFGTSDPEAYFARHGWDSTTIAPGDPEARYERWPFPAIPRSVPGMPRTFFVTGSNGERVRRAQPDPISTASADYYAWGAVCDGWHLVRRDGLSVTQERMPPGTSENRHRHSQATQFFYVLAGRLEIEVDGLTHSLESGMGLEVRPRAPHHSWNRGPIAAEFLVISQPPSHEDRELVPI